MIDSVASKKALVSLRGMDLDSEDLSTIITQLTTVVDEVLTKAPVDTVDSRLWKLAADAKTAINHKPRHCIYVDIRENALRSSAKTFCRVLDVPPDQDCF